MLFTLPAGGRPKTLGRDLRHHPVGGESGNVSPPPKASEASRVK